MYKLLHRPDDVNFFARTEENTKVDLLHKNQGANPYNVLLISGMLTLSSVVITWIIEWVANGILLQH